MSGGLGAYVATVVLAALAALFLGASVIAVIHGIKAIDVQRQIKDAQSLIPSLPGRFRSSWKAKSKKDKKKNVLAVLAVALIAWSLTPSRYCEVSPNAKFVACISSPRLF